MTLPSPADCVLEPDTDLPGSGLGTESLAASPEACSMRCHQVHCTL